MNKFKYKIRDKVIVRLSDPEGIPYIMAEGVIRKIAVFREDDDLPYSVQVEDAGEFWCGETNPRWMIVGYSV